jgi:hypothetical protein
VGGDPGDSTRRRLVWRPDELGHCEHLPHEVETFEGGFDVALNLRVKLLHWIALG